MGHTVVCVKIWCSWKGDIIIVFVVLGCSFCTFYKTFPLTRDLMLQKTLTIRVLTCDTSYTSVPSIFNSFYLSPYTVCLFSLYLLFASSLRLFLHDNDNRLTSPNTDLHIAIASIWFVEGCCRAKLPLFSPLLSHAQPPSFSLLCHSLSLSLISPDLSTNLAWKLSQLTPVPPSYWQKS